MQRDEVVIQDIINAARFVIEFVTGFDKDTFISDWKTRSAVLYQLTVIGEAVKRLSKEFRARYPEVPWTLIAGIKTSGVFCTARHASPSWRSYTAPWNQIPDSTA